MIDVINIPVNNDPRRIDLEGPVLVAHQAEFMPWLGFISKAAMGDIYLILDDTQFKKSNFQNRNKIRFPNKEGWLWLNIPVKNKDSFTNMLDVEIAGNEWKDKHLKTIQTSYGKSPYFSQIYAELYEIYANFDSNKLVEINILLIKYAFKKFSINTPVYRVSELKKSAEDITGYKTELVISLVRAVNANSIVAGSGGREYLDKERFKENKIDLVFQEFQHPVYKQIHGEFLPHMSFIDLLFNYGDKSVNILPKSYYTR